MTSDHPVFHKVGENLYRLESSGAHYALFKRGGKQIRRFLGLIQLLVGEMLEVVRRLAYFGRIAQHSEHERLVSRPTVNIEGLVGGYTGPGGKTILPHKASAKIPDVLSRRAVPQRDATRERAAPVAQPPRPKSRGWLASTGTRIEDRGRS